MSGRFYYFNYIKILLFQLHHQNHQNANVQVSIKLSPETPRNTYPWVSDRAVSRLFKSLM